MQEALRHSFATAEDPDGHGEQPEHRSSCFVNRSALRLELLDLARRAGANFRRCRRPRHQGSRRWRCSTRPSPGATWAARSSSAATFPAQRPATYGTRRCSTRDQTSLATSLLDHARVLTEAGLTRRGRRHPARVGEPVPAGPGVGSCFARGDRAVGRPAEPCSPAASTYAQRLAGSAHNRYRRGRGNQPWRRRRRLRAPLADDLLRRRVRPRPARGPGAAAGRASSTRTG